MQRRFAIHNLPVNLLFEASIASDIDFPFAAIVTVEVAVTTKRGRETTVPKLVKVFAPAVVYEGSVSLSVYL